MDNTLYQSKSQMKRLERQYEQEKFLKEKEISRIEKEWEDVQIQAASAQSVLNYMLEQVEAHKDELEADIITKTEEQVSLRRKEIEELLMTGKARYEQQIGEIK